MKAFFALIWKDLRHNAHWAAIGVAIFGGVFGFIVYSGRQPYERWNLTRDMFEGCMRFLFPLIGAALGPILIHHESRGDEWSFLVHRPVKLATIFWSKVITAWLLYGLACVLPAWLVLAKGIAMHKAGAMRYMTPGDVASAEACFNARETSDVACGLMCIAMGTIAGMGAGRWFATRSFVLAAIPSTVIVCSAAEGREPWSGTTIALIVMVIALVAARASFMVSASRERMSPASVPALALLVYAGLATVAGFSCYAVLLAANYSRGDVYVFWVSLGPAVSALVFFLWGSWERWVAEGIIGSDFFGIFYSSIAIIASTGVGVIACFILARVWRMSRSATIAWMFAGLAMGVLGPFVLLCISERPAAVRCYACGKKRFVTSACCERCKATPLTAPDGTEVFAPLRGATPADFSDPELQPTPTVEHGMV